MSFATPRSALGTRLEKGCARGVAIGRELHCCAYYVLTGANATYSKLEPSLWFHW